MKTTQKFIEDAKKVHGDKYDYSKVEYSGAYDKVCIICPEHGEFKQTAHSHLIGHGCPKCGKNKNSYKNTKEYFILKAREIHGWKYDYSKVEYNGSNEKVCIICPEHGEFWQTPHNHLNSRFPCKKCKSINRKKKETLTLENFIKRAKEVHGDKYDYSKVDLGNKDEKGKIVIICYKHGKFKQTPSSHLQGRGCNKCSKPVFDTNSFIKRAKEVHRNKYDYSKVEYNGSNEKVCIICPKHGEFWQTPSNHISGKGCFFCKKEENDFKKMSNTKEFVNKAKEIHGNKYNYSKVEYKKAKEKVCIICPEHGEFWQTPNKHLIGEGCPLCLTFSLENEVASFLDFNGIKYERAKRFKWLGKMSLDFYLPEYNIAIECQGIQHYEPVVFFGGEKTFKKQLKRDSLKKEQCNKNGVHLLYYTKEILKKENEITNINELKKILK